MRLILSIALLSLCWSGCAQQEPNEGMAPTVEETEGEHVGLLLKNSYIHAGNGDILTGYILNSYAPIDFSGDDFVNQITVYEVQLVWPFEKYSPEDYIGKKIAVNGDLFGGHTAHHCRQVLLEVEEVRIIE